MKSLLVFLLELAAVAGLVGTLAGLLAWGTRTALRPILLKGTPSIRADVSFVLGVLPALAVLATVAAAALPPLAAALGLGPDHCLDHGHHLHLCLTHAAALRPALAAFGAIALAVFLFRALAFGERTRDMRAKVKALLKLGAARTGGSFPVILVPGSPRLCHATGLLRRRILMSSDLAALLPAGDLAAALAHEEAHLQRRDPLSGWLLSFAGLFAPPLFQRWFQEDFRAAAEESSDAQAAVAVGDPTQVAAALVRVARLQRCQSAQGLEAPAFGEQGLERRVQRLLDGRGGNGPSRSLFLLSGLAALTALVVALRAPQLHHAVETLLHHLS